MNYTVLAFELTNDPLGRGYAGMSDEEAAADLNGRYRSRNRTSMTASEVLNAIDKDAFLALSDAMKQLVWDVLHIGDLNPFGVEATLMVEAFGAGSVTITSLQELRMESITRAAELGLGLVKVGNVEEVRRNG